MNLKPRRSFIFIWIFVVINVQIYQLLEALMNLSCRDNNSV